jgi:hypothetical protein
MNLYLRLLWTWIAARFKPAIRMGDTIEMSLRVWPGDLDINGHMNNGRYMTITDLAVIEYFTRAGFLPIALRRGWRPENRVTSVSSTACARLGLIWNEDVRSMFGRIEARSAHANQIFASY